MCKNKTTIALWVMTWLLAISVAIISVFIIRYIAIPKSESVTPIQVECAPESPKGVVDTTEIFIDKKIFLCEGDVDVDVTEIGIVSFTCTSEGKTVQIVTNPQEIFVTKYFRKENADAGDNQD